MAAQIRCGEGQDNGGAEAFPADRSGHSIEHDQPEAAVGAIVTMVEQVRRQATS